MQPLSGPRHWKPDSLLQLRTQLSSCSTYEPVLTPFIETSMDIVDILRRKFPGLPDLRMVTEGWSGSEKKAWAGHKRNRDVTDSGPNSRFIKLIKYISSAIMDSQATLQ